jgi:hypothetical protein
MENGKRKLSLPTHLPRDDLSAGHVNGTMRSVEVSLTYRFRCTAI